MILEWGNFGAISAIASYCAMLSHKTTWERDIKYNTHLILFFDTINLYYFYFILLTISTIEKTIFKLVTKHKIWETNGNFILCRIDFGDIYRWMMPLLINIRIWQDNFHQQIMMCRMDYMEEFKLCYRSMCE